MPQINKFSFFMVPLKIFPVLSVYLKYIFSLSECSQSPALSLSHDILSSIGPIISLRLLLNFTFD